MDVQSRETSEWFSFCSCSCKRVILPFLLFTFFLGPAALAQQTSLEVMWKEGALSVTAEKAPLSQVLSKIADRTGIEVQGLEGLQEEVSVRFSGLPLSEGLEKLLANVNYLFLAGTASPQGDPQPARILVFGKRELSPAQKTASEGRMELEDGLAAGDVEKRIESLRALAQAGNVEALKKALSDPNPTIQSTALDLLAVKDSHGTMPLLVDATKSKQAGVRFRALELLNNSQADEQVVLSALGEAVAGDDMATKGYAIRALADRGGPEAIGYLRQALHDPDPSIRMATINHIVRAVPSAQRVLLLQEAASDADENVRSAASSSLEEGISEQ